MRETRGNEIVIDEELVPSIRTRGSLEPVVVELSGTDRRRQRSGLRVFDSRRINEDFKNFALHKYAEPETANFGRGRFGSCQPSSNLHGERLGRVDRTEADIVLEGRPSCAEPRSYGVLVKGCLMCIGCDNG